MNIVYLLKWYLVAASIYLILVGLMYVFDVKLLDAISWPNPALVYAKFIGSIYGLTAILVGLLGVESSRNLEKYKNLLYLVAIWGLFYAGNLIYTSLTANFTEVFSQTPSVYVWMPSYNYYLFFEAGMLVIFSLLVFLWSKKQTK